MLGILLSSLNAKILYVYKQSLRHSRNAIKSDNSLKWKTYYGLFVSFLPLQVSEMASSKY